jgi:hypothetical protein
LTVVEEIGIEESQMTVIEYARLRDDLEGLGRRIDKRVQELKDTGRFPEEFERVAKEIHARRLQQHDRVSEAIHSGSEWNILAAELMRDYNSLSDNVLRLEQRIDGQFAKDQKG